ncbi:MAG TPA: TIGR01777 family oxidoreductase [Blastocatellia bacterium]|nr:TIGR01777 family oxidoreductase [Blastocatellia bacterium]
MKVLMTGATGLIGRNLCEVLTGEGHAVVALSRSPEKARRISAEEVHAWDPQAGPPPQEALAGLDAVVHLAGESVAAKRWNPEQKKRIRESRLIGTRNLVQGLASASPRPRVFVSGSAVGFYGDRGDEVLDERAQVGRGFLPDLCREWEAEALRASDLGIRVVLPRTGVVLDARDGALKKMLPPFRMGVAGPLGSGRQWFPWIHIDDIVGIFRHAVLSESLSGPVNGAAPGIVTNAEFTKQMGAVLHRPAFLPVPEFALRVMMGEMATVVLGSQRVVPEAVLRDGYSFKYPDLAPALSDLLAN